MANFTELPNFDFHSTISDALPIFRLGTELADTPPQTSKSEWGVDTWQMSNPSRPAIMLPKTVSLVRCHRTRIRQFANFGEQF